MVQNLPGILQNQFPVAFRSNNTTEDLLAQIRDAILTFVQTVPTAPPGDILIGLSLGSPFYVGDFMRFVALPNGGSLEVKDTGGVWVEQERWIES